MEISLYLLCWKVYAVCGSVYWSRRIRLVVLELVHCILEAVGAVLEALEGSWGSYPGGFEGGATCAEGTSDCTLHDGSNEWCAMCAMHAGVMLYMLFCVFFCMPFCMFFCMLFCMLFCMFSCMLSCMLSIMLSSMLQYALLYAFLYAALHSRGHRGWAPFSRGVALQAASARSCAPYAGDWKGSMTCAVGATMCCVLHWGINVTWSLESSSLRLGC